MPDLTLRSQMAHARGRLAVGDPRSAVAVGRRILETYPRCVAAYALLGEALLQLGRLDRAQDLLLRAWGACPETASVCLALAAIAGQRGETAVARAWREQAGDLLPEGGREAPEPPAGAPFRGCQPLMPLTRTSLARLWLRQGLAARAARELRALLAEQPGRYDVQVTLAEALWRAGAEAEAARLSQEIVAAHPHCLKALLILGKRRLHGEQDAQARRWLLDAQALDPENRLAQELFGADTPLPPRTARLPYRDKELPPLELPYGDDEDDGELD
jgi:tetratricopeptide (TPR) repeat protein